MLAGTIAKYGESFYDYYTIVKYGETFLQLLHYSDVRGGGLRLPHGTTCSTSCNEDRYITKGMIFESVEHTHKIVNSLNVKFFLDQTS